MWENERKNCEHTIQKEFMENMQNLHIDNAIIIRDPVDRSERVRLSDEKEEHMKIKKIKDLKPGDFFTFHNFGDEPDEKHVYIRREYDRSWQMYRCDKFDNISVDRLCTGDTRVFTDFTF